MIVNKKLGSLLTELEDETRKYISNPDYKERRRYITRLMRHYDTHLTDDERLVILDSLLYELSYKSLLDDDDFKKSIANICFKHTLAFTACGVVITAVIMAFIHESISISGLLDIVVSVVETVF